MRIKYDYRQASKSTYLRWKKHHPNVELSFSQFEQIIFTFNSLFRDYLLETGERAKLPWGMGDFAIAKKRPKQTKISKSGKEYVGLPIDWKKTKAMGHYVYHLNAHTEGFKFRIKWFISTGRFRLAEVWSFKPSRASSRLVNHYIKKDPKNQYKYQEWHLVYKY